MGSVWAWRSQMAVSVCYGIWVTLPTIIQPSFTQWIHIVSNSFLKMGSFSSRITSKDMNALLLFPPARSYSSCAWPWKEETLQANTDICRQRGAGRAVVKVQLLRPQDFLSQRCCDPLVSGREGKKIKVSDLVPSSDILTPFWNISELLATHSSILA